MFSANGPSESTSIRTTILCDAQLAAQPAQKRIRAFQALRWYVLARHRVVGKRLWPRRLYDHLQTPVRQLIHGVDVAHQRNTPTRHGRAHQ